MINTLSMALEKKGLEYVNNLLSEEVVITEKLDTYRIVFEKKDGDLVFYKKDNSEINLIERVLTNIWEDAIIELSIILNEADVPEGITFGLAYTPVKKPIRLSYENLPKYILTDVTKRNQETKKVIESFDYEEVHKWAESFNLGSPPIIFTGKLSEEQKESLIKYGTKDFEDDKELDQIIGKTYSGADIIEGIVIKGSSLIQITSSGFDILNENYHNFDKSRDFYDITLLEINSFLSKYKFPEVLEGNSPDEKYLELICDIFNGYCKEGKIFEDIDPDYLNPPSFGYSGDLNLLLLKNKETISILESGNTIHESLFRVMLSSFRKYRSPRGLLNEESAGLFNTYVYFINEKAGIEIDKKIPIIGPLNETRSENIVVGEVDKKIKTDLDNMRVISSLQKAFKPVGPNILKGKEKCVVYVLDPQPLTKSHQENIETMIRTWKAPVILAHIRDDKREPGNKFRISDHLMTAQIESFCDSNLKNCPAFFSLDSWDILELFQNCRPKYEPIAIITEKNRKSEFVLQLYFEEEIMGGRLDVDKNFNIGDMDNRDRITAYRAIEDGLYYSFREVTPNSIWGIFDLISSEYKEWRGSVPKQFEPNLF